MRCSVYSLQNERGFENVPVGRKTGATTTTVTPEEDLKERTIFRLRTREGLDASRFPGWTPILAHHVREGLLTQDGTTFRLTDRGTEVCDAILADLVAGEDLRVVRDEESARGFEFQPNYREQVT